MKSTLRMISRAIRSWGEWFFLNGEVLHTLPNRGKHSCKGNGEKLTHIRAGWLWRPWRRSDHRQILTTVFKHKCQCEIWFWHHESAITTLIQDKIWVRFYSLRVLESPRDLKIGSWVDQMYTKETRRNLCQRVGGSLALRPCVPRTTRPNEKKKQGGQPLQIFEEIGKRNCNDLDEAIARGS